MNFYQVSTVPFEEVQYPLNLTNLQDEVVTESGRVKVRSRQADEDEDFVGGKLSKQILSEAKKQLQEIEEEASPKSARAKGATVLEPPKVDKIHMRYSF